MSEEKPVVLATRCLRKIWEDRMFEGNIPPMDLIQAVTQVTVIAGYKKATIEKMVIAYLKREREVNQ